MIYKGNYINYLRHLGVHIGDNCQILTQAENFGSEPWLVEISDSVTVCAGVRFITHDAASRLFRESLPDSSIYGNRFGKILIQSNCFIGVNSLVLPGVTVSPNSVIGSGSVVTKDVPPNTVVAGVPARIISSLDDYIKRYKEKMVPIKAQNRMDLRRELTVYFWGEER